MPEREYSLNIFKKIAHKLFKKFILRKILNKVLVASENSEAYFKFCELVYGKDLTQFNMANMEQIDKLLEILNVNEDSSVLDLGCATGAISEYLSDVTHAQVLGIDYAINAVKIAQERTSGKTRLTFLCKDFNRLTLPENSFDAIIAIDTIYFVDNLEKTIAKLLKLLKPHGVMAIFFTQRIKVEESPELLLPNNTKLASALKNNNVTYDFYDFTKMEIQHWKKTNEIAECLKDEFEKEGNIFLFQTRKHESEKCLKYIESNRISRYLYHIKT